MWSFVFLVAICLAPSIALSQQYHFSAEEREIIRLQDIQAPASSIAGFLTSKDKAVAWRAAIAIANLGDSTIRPILIERLRREARPDVRDAEVFALGMLGPNEDSWQTLADIKRSNDTAVAEALARTSPVGRFEKTVNVFSAMDSRSQSMGLIRLALRGYSGEDAINLATTLFQNDLPEIRWRAVYALSRMNNSSGLKRIQEGLADMLLDQGSIYTRMFAATAIGRINDSSSTELLTHALRGEENWQVEVNLLNALSKSKAIDSELELAFKVAVNPASMDNPQSIEVAQIALDDLEQMVKNGAVKNHQDSVRLRAWLETFTLKMGVQPDVPIRVRSKAMKVLARLRSDLLHDEIESTFNAHDLSAREDAAYVIGNLMDTTYFGRILQSMPQIYPIDQYIRLGALDSMWQLAKRNSTFRSELENKKFANIYRYLLIRIGTLETDPAVVATSLSMLQDTSIIIDSTFRTEAETAFEKEMNTFLDTKYHDQAASLLSGEAWLRSSRPALLQSMETMYDSSAHWMGWRDVHDSIAQIFRSLNSPAKTGFKEIAYNPRFEKIDWPLLESIVDTLLISTPYGLLQVQLDKKNAPLTCLNMLRLTQGSFFINETFHRVVPNFVVQAGDPTITGWGGPGYSIRTEISPLEYSTPGMIGMASSGKNTEGSQWFITQVPTPHLDGRYTIFGHVFAGMPAAFKVQQYDQIENIRTYHR